MLSMDLTGKDLRDAREQWRGGGEGGGIGRGRGRGRVDGQGDRHPSSGKDRFACLDEEEANEEEEEEQEEDGEGGWGEGSEAQQGGTLRGSRLRRSQAEAEAGGETRCVRAGSRALARKGLINLVKFVLSVGLSTTSHLRCTRLSSGNGAHTCRTCAFRV